MGKSPMPAPAMLSSSSSSAKGKVTVSDVAPIQRPAQENDDLIMTAGEPMPRVVFQGASSFDEAEEATVDKMCLSSPESAESAEVAATNQLSDLSLYSNSDSDTESCLVVETARGLPVPNPAMIMKALKFVSRSTEAQTVLFSVTDHNVWDAARQNPVYQDFIKSNQTPSRNWFMSKLENIKLTAVDLAGGLSGSLQNIYGFSSDVNADTKTTTMDITVGASIMGLLTFVAMVVLLKRF